MKKLAFLAPMLLISAALAATPKDTLVYQNSADIPTLDPTMVYDTASGSITENIYETLLTYKGASLTELEPLLATGWKESNAGKTYTFDLRKNVKFHSGNTMTCDDAAYSIRRNLVVNSPESGNWFISEALLGTGSNANDDKTITWDRIAKAVSCNNAGQLVFNLPKVDPAFLAKMAYTGQSIVDKAHAIKQGEWDGTERTWKEWVGKDLNDSGLSKNPSGTGAYQIVRRDANTLLARAFPGYWGQKPAIQNVIIQKVPEQAARYEAIKRGDADIIETGPRSTLSQLQGPGITILDDLPNTTATAFFMNQNVKDPGLLGSGKLDGRGIPANFFSDVNVRRAFSYAFDYERYIKEVQLGKGIQRTMLLPDSFPGYAKDVKTYKYDAKQAESYFKRAFGGDVWKNGFTLRMNYRAGAAASQTAAELLKRNIEAINPKFKVEIGAKQWSTMLNDSKAGKEAMIIIGWAPDYADPDNFVHTFYHSEGYYSPRSGFSDRSIDAWVNQARNTTNTAKRNQLYKLVANRSFAVAPFIYIPAGVNFTVYRSELKGVSKNTYNPMTSFSATGTFWKDLSK
ncbi:ABC transporter substrate-binding protein [Deinococcus peraridilitoris]|uniref:ABC-type dipeptide transport system, periplasmic component n=1 Tax=Deinococcus peraridilitoris (strain DSM 19664 / LMG 22246 / CIP 109416 / KR-200) TaxID=937777 RepID=L0A079_DEIPD|nr:ABC transporter substrate-binding protein [Deinococcus peraridilitoris]AFZ66577.1 ABC-type dipeptide transport system, periplasmic component [Deinococcus peraridilitoris DSM 19664]